MKYYPNIIVATVCLLFLASCASNDPVRKGEEGRKINKSFLAGKSVVPQQIEVDIAENEVQARDKFTALESMQSETLATTTRIVSAEAFDTAQQVTIAADGMPIGELVHYAFGDILDVNYVLNEDAKQDATKITLNVQQPVSKLELFELLSATLSRHQITIDYDSDTFFIQKNQLSKARAIIGIGRDPSSVPNTSGQILQLIPIKYGIKISLERTLNSLLDAAVTPDFEQSAVFVMGDRANVLRAIELVQILDVPANRGKHISLMSLTYIPSVTFLEEIGALLTNEGISVSVGITGQNDRNVSLVPLNHIGAIAIFATDEDLLNRVKYWALVLDQPTQGENNQYFIYYPKYARAVDLGDSIGQLLSIGRPKARNERATGENAERLREETESNNAIVSSQDISFVVDERSNTLIFSTKGSKYQTLLPLLQRLDVLPKQILLEVMIAEVSLTDDFRYGVEFALRNSSEFGLSTGALGATTIGGLNFNFLNNGVEGDTQVNAAFFKDNQLVNVISNPTLLVRDGVSASISVGTSIPVQDATVVDQGVTTSSVSYRKTGVSVEVTPTVNAQGVVIMSISQEISNTARGSAGSTTPSIFERAISTEAVINSGETVLLGGLISEDSALGDTKVPVLGDLPLVGGLFKGQTDSITKTELIMLVTPKVIESEDQWQRLISDFQNGLESLEIVN